MFALVNREAETFLKNTTKMKNEKIKLTEVIINSFVTKVDNKDQNTIEGGSSISIALSIRFRCYEAPQPLEPQDAPGYETSEDYQRGWQINNNVA